MSTPQWVPLRHIVGPPGPSIEVLPWSMQGQVRAVSGIGRFPIVGGTYSILSVGCAVEQAPLGGPIIVDVKRNGVSIYATPDRRPRVNAGAHFGVGGEHQALVLRHGDYLTVDVVQAGQTFPGMHLTVAARLEQIVAVEDV